MKGGKNHVNSKKREKCIDEERTEKMDNGKIMNRGNKDNKRKGK